MGFAVNAAIGSLFGLAAAILLLLVFSLIMASGKIGADLMNIITVGAVFCGSFIGSIVAVKRHGHQALIVGLLEGGILFFITLLCGAFTDAESLIGEITLPLMLGALLGGALGGIICSRPKKRKI